MTGKSTRPADASPTLSDPIPTTGEHPGGPRRTEPPFPAVKDGVEEYLASDFSGHDLHHVWRVFRLTQQFAAELDADRVVVGCAALTHDLHRVVGAGTGCDPIETLPQVREILERADVSPERVSAVEHCVAVHDELAFRGEDPTPETLEAKILRDADNLDAMGAIGIGRTFAFGGVHETPLWDPTGREYSQMYHFEDKLLRLRGELHTAPARRVAEERHAFLTTFFDRFIAEWHGDR